ncbi:DNA internalization-related competence protein ComEC/Rec2 [Thermodesulfobacteriota bacterium]
MFRRPLIPLLLSFIGGIFAAHQGFSHPHSHTLPVFLSLIFVLILFFILPLRLRFPLYLIFFFLSGVALDGTAHHESRLLPLAGKRAKVVLEGIVLYPPRVSQETTQMEVLVERIIGGNRAGSVGERVRVTVYKNQLPFIPGDRIRFPARVRHFKNFNNPGRYNYELAMSLRSLTCAVSVSDGRYIVPMGRGNLPFPFEIIEKARRPIRKFFLENLPPQKQSLFRALILGEKQAISAELREPFNVAGLGHVLAVSGLHIGLVAGLAFYFSIWLLSLSYRIALKYEIRKVAAVITCLPVIAYTCLTGLEVSSQRAMIMALVYLFSIILGREKEVWSTLSLAAFVVLAVDPHAFFSISFHLSFMAVIGILWLAPLFFQMIPMPADGKNKIAIKLYRYFAGLLAVTSAAVIFLMPITTFYFHRISLVAVPANLTIVPILGLWVLPLALLSAAALPLSAALGGAFLQLGSWGMDWMLWIIRFWSEIPGAAFWMITPNILEMVLYYALLLFIFSFKIKKWGKIGLILTVIFLTIDAAYWIYRTQFNPCLRVTYLDVGHGNSALIQLPGRERMIIDGGGFTRDNFDIGKMVVAPFLWHSKIKRIDYVVLSHPQADHMNGLRFIASNFRPREFWFNGDQSDSRSFHELMAILEKGKIRRVLPAELGTRRMISGVAIEVLHPVSKSKKVSGSGNGWRLNDNSLVLRVSHAGKSFLFPGDLERKGEGQVLETAGNRLKSDVLLAPHHGSRSSCSPSFLEMVNPQICIISSGRAFGFPNSETLGRLRRAGCRIIRIDQAGAVQLTADPKGLKVRSYVN